MLNGKRMLALGLALVAILAVGATFAGCSYGNHIRGVNEENGQLKSVTFRLPDDIEIRAALGSAIGEAHTLGVGAMQNNTSGTPKLVYWATVDKGGILSWREDSNRVYRFSPNAEVVGSGGIPPAYALLYSAPSSSDIMVPSDVGKLDELYGVQLNLH